MLFGLMTAVIFSRDLFYGMSGDDVKFLQEKLNTNPITRVAEAGPGSLGAESNFFGFKTKEAVKKFQELNRKEVLDPMGLVGATGYVGRLTRAVLNKVDMTTTGIPVIISAMPTLGGDGTAVVVRGKNFDNINNTVYTGYAVISNVESPDGQTITFTIYSPVPDEARKYFKQLPTVFYVGNKNGVSNPINFTITHE